MTGGRFIPFEGVSMSMADEVTAAMRFECLRNGVTLGDAAGDLQWVLQELGEHEPNSDPHAAAMGELEAICTQIDQAIVKAKRDCDVPDALVESWQRFSSSRSDGDLFAMRARGVEFSDLLAAGGGPD